MIERLNDRLITFIPTNESFYYLYDASILKIEKLDILSGRNIAISGNELTFVSNKFGSNSILNNEANKTR